MKVVGTFVLTGRGKAPDPKPRAGTAAAVPLLVLRHAATEWSEQRRLQGRFESALSAAGREAAIAWRLPEGARALRWDVSPARQAIMTAHQIGVGPHAEPRLAEMDWGEWEGRTLADLRASGELTPDMEAEGLDMRPPGGETLREVQWRLADWLREVGQSGMARGVITHNGVLRALYGLATDWDGLSRAPERLLSGHAHRFEVAPGGVTRPVRLNIPLVTAHHPTS